MKLPDFIKELRKGIRYMNKQGYTELRDLTIGNRLFEMGWTAAMKCNSKRLLDKNIERLVDEK